MLLRHQRIKLVILATIILFCYSLSAIFQEKVLRRPYGEGEGERFTFAFAFTAVQCIVYASVAKGMRQDIVFAYSEYFKYFTCFRCHNCSG
jgi:hypothetical protein